MKKIVMLFLSIFSTVCLYSQYGGDSTTLTPDGKWADDALTLCLSNSNNTNASLMCLADAMDTWQGLVNTNYTALFNKLTEPHRSNLKAAQTSWINYKYQQFKLLDTYYGSLQGTDYKQMKLAAEVEILRARSMELYNMLDE